MFFPLCAPPTYLIPLTKTLDLAQIWGLKFTDLNMIPSTFCLCEVFVDYNYPTSHIAQFPEKSFMK